QQQVAAARALPGQPDHLARADALGHAHVEGLAVEPDADAVAAVHRLQRHRQARAQVGGAMRVRATRLLRVATSAGLAPEQAFEEVAETATRPAAGEDLVEVEAFRRAAMAVAVAAGRRLHLVAGAGAAGAQLVVGRALLWVAQRLVGFVDGLELLLGTGFLADIRMVLARQPPVRRLDLGVARAGLDAKDVVVVLVLHRGGCPSENGPRRCRRGPGLSAFRPQAR